MQGTASIYAAGVFVAAIMSIGPAGAQSTSASTDAAAEDIVAAQIRSQGYKCDEPHSARRDTSDSSPGEQAWILNCDNASYRVKLVPDQAAQVEQLD